MFYGTTIADENKVHLNLTELAEHYRCCDNLIEVDDNPELHKDYQLFNLLLNTIPRGEMFLGKHGTGLVTLAEFTKIIESAYESDTIKYMTQSMAFLDDSIDFSAEPGITVETQNDISPLLTDRNMRNALQEDAKHLVELFTEIYTDCEENNAMVQVVEMMELLVMENKHEMLGVAPKSL